MNEKKESNMHFLSLVISLSALAMQQLGKVNNPLTNKIERNLEQAKLTIDMLTMLKKKTQGNLTTEEEKLLHTNLANLQLNYVDELNKGTTENAEKKSTDSAETKKENSGNIS